MREFKTLGWAFPLLALSFLLWAQISGQVALPYDALGADASTLERGEIQVRDHNTIGSPKYTDGGLSYSKLTYDAAGNRDSKQIAYDGDADLWDVASQSVVNGETKTVWDKYGYGPTSHNFAGNASRHRVCVYTFYYCSAWSAH